MMRIVPSEEEKRIISHQIQQLMLGDECAFAEIYDKHCQKVYRLAFRYLKDRALSEEIVQETFIRLWMNKEKLDAEGDLWSYLSVISKRLSLNALREISRSSILTNKLLLNIEEAHNGTEEKVYVHDLEQITEQIISKLPKQQQLVYKLSRVEGLSHKEIADQLHISPNTVKNHMVQALKTLKSNLNFSYIISLALLLFF